jgi:hypothetical protein
MGLDPAPTSNSSRVASTDSAPINQQSPMAPYFTSLELASPLKNSPF